MKAARTPGRAGEPVTAPSPANGIDPRNLDSERFFTQFGIIETSRNAVK
jgi:hypothetical protein